METKRMKQMDMFPDFNGECRAWNPSVLTTPHEQLAKREQLRTYPDDAVLAEGDSVSIISMGGAVRTATFAGCDVRGKLLVSYPACGVYSVRRKDGKLSGTKRQTWYLEKTALAAARRHADAAMGR